MSDSRSRSPGSQSQSPGSRNGSNSTAKRSPSILVTDVRTHAIKGARAPFAGRNYKKQQSGNDGNQPHYTMGASRSISRNTKYTDISIDKLLSNSSDIPSGQSRLPSSYPHSGTAGQNSYDNLRRMRNPHLRPTPDYREGSKVHGKNIRSIPKLMSNLPSRTSKTSQKLVLIPEQQKLNTHNSNPLPTANYIQLSEEDQLELQNQLQRSRAELMPKEARAQEFSRMTAYYICEQFDMEATSEFLKTNHEVKPRLYDEALYVPYALPLLPGDHGFRVKSNNSAKSIPSKQFMEKMIKKSEETDHLYEYYSGVETLSDANNYSMDPELENNDNSPFDPSEPQFFSPIKEEDQENENSANIADSDSPEENAKSKAESEHAQELESALLQDIAKHHAELFIFEYGIVVFWNFSEIHEKNILADLAFASEHPKQLMINPIDEESIETEEFHFDYDSQIHRPRIYNDMITLRSGDHLIKLTMSHSIAQSTKLCLFESRMVNNLQSISKLPKKLALTGRLGLKRNQLLKKSGRLFKLRVDVNLSSSILDTPDFFWSLEPALHPLYTAVREYLEIDQRVQVLNDRCKVFLEFSDIISDSMNEKNTNRITWMIIVIIFMSLFVSVFEFILELI